MKFDPSVAFVMTIYNHKIFESASAEFRRALQDTPRGSIIAIIGCSGAGKSVLRRHVLKERYKVASLWPDNVTPIVETMVLLVNGAYFSSRHFVSHLKNQVLFPDLDWMLEAHESEPDSWIRAKAVEIHAAKLRLPTLRLVTEGREWENLADACQICKCEMISVDHATCLLVNHKNKTPADHLFNLTSWSERYGIRVVLTGIETMPDLWADKGELRRRVRKVWVPPYSGDKEGLKDFARLVASFLGRYETDDPKDIVKMSPELHYATGGLIGELERLFIESAVDGRKLTRQSIESCYYTEKETRDLWDGVRRFFQAHRVVTREELRAAKSIGMRRRP